jgi:TonB family protein
LLTKKIQLYKGKFFKARDFWLFRCGRPCVFAPVWKSRALPIRLAGRKEGGAMRRWGFAVICVGLMGSAQAQNAAPTTDPVPTDPLSCSDHGLERLSGITRVKFRVGVDGTTQGIAVEKTSGNVDLDQAAIDCVAKWKYRPATQNGHPVEFDREGQINWNTPSETDHAERTSLAPDLAEMEPMVHRLGLDTHMNGGLSTILKLTTDNKEWRCRQVFFEIKGEHRVRHWFAQGWDNPDDLLYARHDKGHYIAVHLRADGTFVAAVSMDDATGSGTELGYADVKALMESEVTAWNESGKRN